MIRLFVSTISVTLPSHKDAAARKTVLLWLILVEEVGERLDDNLIFSKKLVGEKTGAGGRPLNKNDDALGYVGDVGVEVKNLVQAKHGIAFPAEHNHFASVCVMYNLLDVSNLKGLTYRGYRNCEKGFSDRNIHSVDDSEGKRNFNREGRALP